MRKSLLLFLFALAATGAQAQTLFVDSANVVAGAANLYVVGNDGVNPTLFVQGGVDIEGYVHVTNNGTGGWVQIVDGSGSGDIAIDNNGAGIGHLVMATGSLVQLAGNFTNNGNVDANVASRVEFTDAVTSQAYSHSGLQAEAQRDFGIVLVSGREVNLSNNMTIMPLGEMEFNAAGPAVGRYVRTNGNFVEMREGSTWDNAYLTAGGALQTNRYVWGNIRRYFTSATTYSFPVGVDPTVGTNGGTQPFAITFNADPTTSAEAADYMEVSFSAAGLPTLTASATTPTCGADAIQAYSGRWTYHVYNAAGVSQEQLTGRTYSVNFRPHAANAAAEPVILIDHAGSAGGNTYFQGLRVVNTSNTEPDWTFANATLVPCATGAANDMTTPATMVYFSEISGGTPAVTPLPVEMLPLQAVGEGDHIRVYWTTLKETNVSHFVLERSVDAQNFQVMESNIASLVGGNSTQPANYEINDNNAEFNRPYFYRLRVVDMDGTETMTNIAEAMITRDGSSTWASFYPNPANASLNLRVFSAENAPMTLRMFDATGRLVYTAEQALEAGVTDINLESALSRMASGNYNAVLMIGTEVSTTKLVITD